MTFAENNLLIWMFKHGLNRQMIERVETIVIFFNAIQIKIKHSLLRTSSVLLECSVPQLLLQVPLMTGARFSKITLRLRRVMPNL